VMILGVVPTSIFHVRVISAGLLSQTTWPMPTEMTSLKPGRP
jgi:hypothetical protein